MKVDVKKPSKFPITLKVTLESDEEVRDLWHRLNILSEDFALIAEDLDDVAYPDDPDDTLCQELWNAVDAIISRRG